ncbi:MAG: hypothetical protein AAF998_10400 [Bacteroidota bacterium]
MSKRPDIRIFRRVSPSDMQSDFDFLSKTLLRLTGTDEEDIVFAMGAYGDWIFHDRAYFSREQPGLATESELDAGKVAWAFMQRFNDELGKAYQSGECSLPRLFPLVYMKALEPAMPILKDADPKHPSLKRFISHVVLRYGVWLYPSSSERAIPVQGAEIVIWVGQGKKIIRGDIKWRPLISTTNAKRREFDFTYFGPPDGHFSLEKRERRSRILDAFPQGLKTVIVEPSIFYAARNDEDYLQPFRLGLSEQYGGKIPVAGLSNIAEAEKFFEDVAPIKHQGKIASVEQLPQSQYLLLASFEFDVDAWEGDSGFLTRLHEALNQYELVKMLHRRGLIPLNKRSSGGVEFAEATGDSYKIRYDESGNTKRGAAIEVSRSDCDLYVFSKIDEDACTVTYGLQYSDNERKFSFENRFSERLFCHEPEPVANFEDDIGPEDDLVLERNELGVTVYKVNQTAKVPTEDGRYRRMKGQEFLNKLKQFNIPVYSHEVATEMGLIGATLHVPLPDRLVSSGETFPGSPRSNRWHGRIAEETLIANRLWMQRDLDHVPWVDRNGTQRTGNYPIYDTMGKIFSNDLIQSKSSTATERVSRYRVYDGGLDDIMGGRGSETRRAVFENVAAQIYEGENITVEEAILKAKARGKLAINSEDVNPYREEIGQRMLTNPEAFRDYFDALLNDKPEQIQGRSYRSVAEAEAARDSGQITERQYRKFLDRLYKRVQAKIISNGSTAEFLRSARRSRFRFGGQRPEQVRRNVTSSSLYTDRVGFARAMARSSTQGGMYGGALVGLVELGRQAFSPEDLDWAIIGRATATGTVGGSLGGAVEVGTQQFLLRNGVRNGLARSAGAGGAAGAIAAPVIEIGMMLFDDYEYSTEDYLGRGSRALVGGAISGSLATGTASFFSGGVSGAELGATAGPIGAVVGCIVGVFVYWVFDISIGDSVEDAARSVYRSFEDRPIMLMEGAWEVRDFGFFQVVGHQLTREEPHLVQMSGPYISYLNPIDDNETLFVEVIPANGLTQELFDGKEKLFVPRKILRPYH